ncbi:MAG TPA: group I intron-associated PD-(D/E)XK endonuclease [Candidatus Elarobacter sp.]|nr:group I intron-associated PD-(D/E)XK endonuclease [Candidatus Elarobacter sp.]
MAGGISGVSFLIQDRLIAVDGDDRSAGGSTAPKRNTKLTGDISELRVAAALVEAGYSVSKPLGENQRYDLVIDDGQRLQRVQVKTGRIRGGVVLFSCSSTHGHRRTQVTTRPYIGQIELLAVFCADNGKVYLLPEAELTRSKSHLRLVPPRNNMVKTIRWASQFELA